jgi:hypothetical protein
MLAKDTDWTLVELINWLWIVEAVLEHAKS